MACLGRMHVNGPKSKNENKNRFFRDMSDELRDNYTRNICLFTAEIHKQISIRLNKNTLNKI